MHVAPTFWVARLEIARAVGDGGHSFMRFMFV